MVDISTKKKSQFSSLIMNGETHVKEMPYIRTELYQCIITVDKITDLDN